MNDIILYPSKVWTVVLAILSLILAILCAGVVVMHDEVQTNGSTVLKAGLAAVLLLGAFGRNVYRLFNPIPRLIVNREGITENATLQKVGLIPWAQIAEITVYRDHLATMLGVVLKDPEGFYQRLPSDKASTLRDTFQRRSVHVGIPQASLSVPVDDLRQQIMAYREALAGVARPVFGQPVSVAAAAPAMPAPDPTPAPRCTACGSASQGTKFCPNCGQPMPRIRTCSQCGIEVRATTKFCPDCGGKIV